MPEHTTRLGARGIRRLIAATVVLLGVAALLLNLDLAGAAPGIKGDPMPPLYPVAQLTLAQQLAPAPQARAARDFARWVAVHPVRDDQGFEAFALQHVGPPPGPAVQRGELAVLHRLKDARTPAAARAAAWLEKHGKKDVWKLYFKQYAAFAGTKAAKRPKAVFKAALKLANALATAGKARFARPSPYIADPTLGALNQGRFTKKFSYPAKHAIISTAAAAVLSRDEPSRAAEFRWMADEVAFSRMDAGGHYPSDVAAGIYLGTLVALYEQRFSATA